MSSPHAGGSDWAKSKDEEDRVETLIRGSGCWDQHIGVVDCMGENGDWRKCQKELGDFRTCMIKGQQEKQKKEKEEAAAQRKWIKVEDFTPERQEDGWFMSDEQNILADQREILYMRANEWRRKGEHEKALQVFLSIRDQFVHKGSFLFVINDSILSCALECSGQTTRELLSMLDRVRESVMNYGDQLQYFILAYKVHSLVPSPPIVFRSLVLLCSSLDLPDHWFSLLDLPLSLHGIHFRLGCLIKARLLLNFQVQMSKGFIKAKITRQIAQISSVLDGEFSSNTVSNAEEKMRSTSIRVGRNDDDLNTPAHLVRWRDGCMLTPDSAHSLLSSFISSYSWLLQGMDHLLNESLTLRAL